MKRRLLACQLFALLLLALASSCASKVGPTPAPAESAPPGRPEAGAPPEGKAPAPTLRVVGYAPNWIHAKGYPESLDYARLTHLKLAFENPVNAAGDLSFSKINTPLMAKARAQGVKVLVSLGGGAASEDKAMRQRWLALVSPGQRKAFAARIIAYVEKHGFDGADLDLEGPAINADFAPFVEELAPLFRASGKLLTAALSPGYGGGRVPRDCLERFDFVSLMAYNATGPWKPKQPGPHASLEFARSNVAWWVRQGLPRDRLVLGVPFYGQGFGASATRDQSGIPYRTIIARHPGAENSDMAGNTIWYNGLPTIRAKCGLVRREGLGGIMIWSLDQDAAGEKSLLRAISEALQPPPALP